MLSCCIHLKYMIIIKVFLWMILICIMLSNPIFSNDLNKWQIELKFHHQLLYWLNIVQCLEVTLEEFTWRMFNNIKKLSIEYSLVDMTCDQYFNNSLKNLTRKRWGHDLKLLFNYDIPLPRKLRDSFLKYNDNKTTELILCWKIQSYQEDAQSLNVTKGEPALFNSTLGELISINTAKEANQKLAHHMIHCMRSRVKQCAIRAVDADFVISLIANCWLAKHFSCVVFARVGSAVRNRFHNINTIAEELGERKFRALPFFYLLIGCYIVSSFFNQSKCKLWDRWTGRRCWVRDLIWSWVRDQYCHTGTIFCNWTIHWSCVLWAIFKFNWLRENAKLGIFIA